MVARAVSESASLGGFLQGPGGGGPPEPVTCEASVSSSGIGASYNPTLDPELGYFVANLRCDDSGESSGCVVSIEGWVRREPAILHGTVVSSVPAATTYNRDCDSSFHVGPIQSNFGDLDLGSGKPYTYVVIVKHGGCNDENVLFDLYEVGIP